MVHNTSDAWKQEEVYSEVMEEQQGKTRHRKKQLYKLILQQMEFYFSDSNLTKDRFLNQLINQDPYVDLEVFLRFNKIRKLTESVEDIRKAISKSTILELSEDGNKIRRKIPIQIKEDVDDCTIYVERLKSDTTHEWLTCLFSEFGKVTYVSIPRYKSNGMVKGFAFVEFENKESVQEAVKFFESIGRKMASNMDPQNLCSIATYEGDNKQTDETVTEAKPEVEETQDENKKRRRSSSPDKNEEKFDCKKIKTDSESEETSAPEPDTSQNQEEEKKKPKKKKNKNKKDIKDLGLQILTKKEWKKMRNHYLDLQRKKMKELKQYLHKQRFNKSCDGNKNSSLKSEESSTEKLLDESVEESPETKRVQFVPGVIVKVNLQEPCQSNKKLKNELKSNYPDIQYIDFSLPTECEEIFLRFSDGEQAKQFCSSNFPGKLQLLEGEEEKQYWEKIVDDRNKKLRRNLRKQRGREKLLKKAEQEKAQHIRFDDK